MADMIQQRNLVLRLDHSRVGHELLTIDHGDPLALQREEDRRLDDVDSQRLIVQAALFELDLDLARDVFSATHLRRHGAAQERNSGARAFSEPRTVELVMAGGRAEIPQDGLVILRKQGEAADLVLCPRADVRGRKIAHVVHVETEERAHLRFREKGLGARQALAAQPVEVDSLFPIHRHRSICLECHDAPPFLLSSGLAAESARRLEYRLLCRNRRILERRRKRNRHVHGPDSLHRGVQIVKRTCRDHGSDLRR